MLETLNFPQKEFFIDVFKNKIYLVGGTIRDYLLYNQTGNDRDIDMVVVDHSYEEIEKKLSRYGKTNTVGKSFAVIKFSKRGKTFDISVPRKDSLKDKDSHSHKNFIIDYGPHIKLEEDLKRRDFTCNSVAMRLIDNKIYDPFHGIEAIRERRILMTGPENFFDDPLRILRGARFASVHNFSIDPQIYMNSKNVKLDELSKERICDELFRMLLESERPSVGLKEFLNLTVLEKLFPDLFKLSLTIQDSIFHPEKDEYGHHTVWVHTMIAVDIAKRLSQMFKLSEEETLTLLLAALLHDLGKACTTKWEFKRGRMTITSIFHDSKGIDIGDHLLTDLKIETRRNFPLKKTVLNLIKYHHRIFELYRNREDISFKAISRLVRDLEARDFLLLLLDFADRQSREPNPLDFTELDDISQWILQKKEEFKIDQETIKPIIMGRDLLKLKVPPGRKMGEYLKKLYELQLDGIFKSKKEGLIFFKKNILCTHGD
jgi:tRNA nucleotidyltransferase/poly(A) polymerase